ncbi:MAG: hypothetical protein GY854_26905 [Deltaproteobacteria bacterium]|nr:hypothetical protein [Deltaproteobacteria bacterium]
MNNRHIPGGMVSGVKKLFEQTDAATDRATDVVPNGGAGPSGSSRKPDGDLQLWLRLAVTVAVPVAMILANRIQTPLGAKILDANTYLDTPISGLFSLGVAPILSAFMMVEFVAA